MKKSEKTKSSGTQHRRKNKILVISSFSGSSDSSGGFGIYSSISVIDGEAIKMMKYQLNMLWFQSEPTVDPEFEKGNE